MTCLVAFLYMTLSVIVVVDLLDSMESIIRLRPLLIRSKAPFVITEKNTILRPLFEKKRYAALAIITTLEILLVGGLCIIMGPYWWTALFLAISSILRGRIVFRNFQITNRAWNWIEQAEK